MIKRLMAVNGWSEEDAALNLEMVFETSSARSRHQWTLDISALADLYGVGAAGAGPAPD